MKKIILSAAVAAMAFSTSAMAADKGIDIDVSGQATVYYQTSDDNGIDGSYGPLNNVNPLSAIAIGAPSFNDIQGTTTSSMFDQDSSSANIGVQLNLGADLGNNFTFGSQITYLGTAGLEKNLVGGVMQTAGVIGVNGNDNTGDLALTKIFLAKQIGNTTLKIGRQELPKSLSPLAFSEGWNVYKNTFDAIVAINTDIPNTTLVGAYVSAGTGTNLGTTSNLSVTTNHNLVGTDTVDDTAYMITASTTAIPMTTVTASYYHISQIADTTAAGFNGVVPGAVNEGIGADAYWLDVKIADKGLPMGLNVGLQAGQIKPDQFGAGLTATLTAVNTAFAALAPANDFRTQTQMDDTTAMGAKISLAPADALTLSAAYTSVDGDQWKSSAAIKNVGTGVKTPLYTQMVANQNIISLDSDTLVLKAGYNMGDMGSISVAYGMSNNGKANLMGTDALGNAIDYNELDVVYKIKAGGVQYFAAYVMQDFDAAEFGQIETHSFTGAQAYTKDATKNQIVRLWARYNF